MARNIESMESYYENVTYGEESFDSEIHGPMAEQVVREKVIGLVKGSEELHKQGDKEGASKLEKMVYHIQKEVANVAVGKQEHASSLHSTSNWSDMRFMDKVYTEKYDSVDFNEEGKLAFTIFDENTNTNETKTVEEMSSEFEEKGNWMQPLMVLKEKLAKEKNSMGHPPSVDINFATNNLIQRNWKSMISDVDMTLDPNGISKGYRLQSILHEAMDENGNLPEGYNLDKWSFDPAKDTRLFANISNELRNTFYGTDGSENKEKGADPISEESNTAEGLMDRINPKQKA